MKTVKFPDGSLINFDANQKWSNAADSVNIVVQLAGGNFTYAAPTVPLAQFLMAVIQNFVASDTPLLDLLAFFPQFAIFAFSPTVATSGEAGCTITGNGFIQGCTVKVGNTDCTVTYVDPMNLTVTIPPTQLNTDVTVTNPSGVSVTLPTAFLYVS